MLLTIPTPPSIAQLHHLRAILLTLVQVFGASLLIALCSQICIPLFFSPVPLSLQTFGVLLIAAFLGPKKGTASVLLYIGEGLFFPFYSEGSMGAHCLFGTTFGYFLGFILQAFIVGWYFEKRSDRSVAKTLGFLIFACMANLGLGVLWLGHFVGWNQVLVMGFFPFIPGELLKCLAITKMLR